MDDWLTLITQFDTWLIVLGTILVIRQLFVIFSAEQGRKQDLVKKLYKGRTDFNLSVLIPYLHSADLTHLLQLLKAIEAQEYPSSRISVNIVCTPETANDLNPDMLNVNVKRWTHPEQRTNYGQAVSWLIERCLASGGNQMFTFLKPNDMIKPDFFQNIVAGGFESSIMQGYVATRRQATTPLGQVVALSKRLINRIGNAGRYHLGLSCRLQDSGWAIKQEVLEMIPYRRGLDLDNLEYSLRLNLSNFRVTWAPNVVVYSDEAFDFIPFITNCVGAFFNRIQVFTRYGLPLLFRSLIRLDFAYIEEFITVIKPPHFMAGMLFALLAYLALEYPVTVPGDPIIWASFAGTVFVLHILSLLVARSKANDYATSILWTPLLYIAGIISIPVALINFLVSLSLGTGSHRSYKTQYKTRFNETIDPEPSMFDTAHQQEAVIRDMLVENAPNEAEMSRLRRNREQGISPKQYAQPSSANAPSAMSNPNKKHAKVVEKTVPISNGKRQVDAILKTKTSYEESPESTTAEEVYQMTLEYKTVSFSTQTYRILDQAFYELESKMLSKGLTIVSCGSCGYFYNPTADVPNAVNNTGVCLFGKKGRNVNLNTDAVSVVSPSCPYHASLDHREALVREWQESLASKASQMPSSPTPPSQGVF